MEDEVNRRPRMTVCLFYPFFFLGLFLHLGILCTQVRRDFLFSFKIRLSYRIYSCQSSINKISEIIVLIHPILQYMSLLNERKRTKINGSNRRRDVLQKILFCQLIKGVITFTLLLLPTVLNPSKRHSLPLQCP